MISEFDKIQETEINSRISCKGRGSTNRRTRFAEHCVRDILQPALNSISKFTTAVNLPLSTYVDLR